MITSLHYSAAATFRNVPTWEDYFSLLLDATRLYSLPSFVDENGNTWLHYACYGGRPRAGLCYLPPKFSPNN